MKQSTTEKKRKVSREDFAPSKKEVEARQKAEEFWSDPCWQEPLDQPSL